MTEFADTAMGFAGFTPLLVSGVQKVPLCTPLSMNTSVPDEHDEFIGYSMETIGDDEYKPGIFIPSNYPTSPAQAIYICVNEDRDRDTEQEWLLLADGWSRPAESLVNSINHSMADNQGADMYNHMFLKPLTGKTIYYTMDANGDLDKNHISIGITGASLRLEGAVGVYTRSGTNYICREVTPENIKSIYDQYNPPTAPTAPVTKESGK